MGSRILVWALVLSSVALGLDHVKPSEKTGGPAAENIVKVILVQAEECLGSRAHTPAVAPAKLKTLTQAAKLLDGFSPSVNPEDTLAVLLPSMPEAARPVVLQLLAEAKKCWDKPPFKAATGPAQILGQLLASERYRQWTTPAAKTPAPDTRPENEGSWILAFENPLPGGDTDEFVLKPGHGLTRPPRGPDGKEILPPNHLLLRFDPRRNGYRLYTVDEKGNPILSRVPQQAEFPAILINAGRISSFRIESDNRAITGAEVILPSLELRLRLRNNYDVGELKEVFGTSLLSAEFDSAWIAARARAKMPRDSAHPVRSAIEPLAVSFIEEELQIGSATNGGQPLSYSWVDGSKNEFITVDEGSRTVYRQTPEIQGKNQLERFEIVDPARAGKSAASSSPHYVTAIKELPASGIKSAFDDEKQTKRGWVVRDEKGYLWKLEEDQGSLRGELSAKKKPAQFRPLLAPAPTGDKR